MKKSIFLSEPALVCCAGNNNNELYNACLCGSRSGFVMRSFGGKNYPVGQIKIELPEPPTKFPAAAAIKDFEIPVYAANTRIIRVINAALCQMDSGIEKIISKYGKEKIGVCLGSCDNGSEASIAAHNAYIKNNAFPGDYSLRYQSASFLADYIAKKYDIKGPAFTIAAACASGASAIMRGAEMIRAGLCNAVIAGGADIVSEIVFTGFNALEAVSDEFTNPFSKNRKGINLGEGAAFFILDTEKTAVELLGAGESADAYHMTAPGIDGEGPARAMKAALKDAGLESDKIGYINLHGTGTGLNDKAESLALRKVFSKQVPASSTKPITGHTLGAAGALEAAICWMVINEKRGLPVHLWDGVTDEEAPFLPVREASLQYADSSFKSPSICMTNSFAFGGCNVSLILGTNE